jgi:hypothetical protein
MGASFPVFVSLEGIAVLYRACGCRVRENSLGGGSAGYSRGPANPDITSRAFGCVQKDIPREYPFWVSPRYRWEPFGSRAGRKARILFLSRYRVSLRLKTSPSSAEIRCSCVACGFSLSCAPPKQPLLKSRLLLPDPLREAHPAVKMPRRPQKTGGLSLKRRGQMTHAGLALMAVRARLGPA